MKTKRIISLLLSILMLLSITTGMSFEASAATYEKISNLKVPRFIQYYSNGAGDGSCWLASFASIDCYRRGNTYNGKTYSYGKDYNHDDALYKYLLKKNGNSVAWPGASSSLYKDEKISLYNSYSLSALYKALKAGKPVVIYSYGAARHASVVIGHKKSASSLSADNFVVMDVSQGYSQDKCYVSLSSWIKRCGTPSVMWYQDETPVTTCTGTFNFNANGGSGSMSSFTVKSGNALTITKNAYTKSGYTFSGWNCYRHSDGKWITASNGWQTASAISSNGYSKKVYSNGWSGNYNDSWLVSGRTTETYTFYAVWTGNTMTIKYNANGGNCLVGSGYRVNDSDIIYNSNSDKIIEDKWTYNNTKQYGLYDANTFQLCYKDGYKFGGWSTTKTGEKVFSDQDATVKPSDINSSIVNGNCSVVLYAIWVPDGKTYEFNYHAKSYAITYPQNGYHISGSPVTISSVIPTYKPFTVTYNANGGTMNYAKTEYTATFNYWVDMNNQFVAVDKQVKYYPGKSYVFVGNINLYDVCTYETFSANAPTKVGYKFVGWYNKNSTDGTLYESGKNLIARDMTLYAQWETCTHSYDSGVITKQPTVSSTGVKTYTCTVCGATKTETIPKLEQQILTGWQEINGIYYYYNSDGTQKNGWIKDDNGKWHYYYSDGKAATNWNKINNKWYHFGTDGLMRTGWNKINNIWYYFNGSGHMLTGWQKISDKWYYFNGSGHMQTGWQKIGGTWYLFNGSGHMLTGWQHQSGNWYYFESSGAMLANTSKKIGGKTYKFNSSGQCTNP